MTRARVLPKEADKQRYVREMFDRIAPRYALVNTVMTAGMDRRWRRLTVASLGLPTGSRVLDLACGPGEIGAWLVSGGHRPIGVDLSWGMLRAGESGGGDTGGDAAWHGPAGFPRAQGDAALIPLRSGSVDGITCGFGLRNFTDAPAVFAEAYRVLRPGGRLAILEVSEPGNRIVRAGHRIYFHRVVPLIGSALCDATAYRYLPQSVAYLPAPPELVHALEEHGFGDVQHRSLGGGAVQLVTATRTTARATV